MDANMNETLSEMDMSVTVVPPSLSTAADLLGSDLAAQISEITNQPNMVKNDQVDGSFIQDYVEKDEVPEIFFDKKSEENRVKQGAENVAELLSEEIETRIKSNESVMEVSLANSDSFIVSQIKSLNASGDLSNMINGSLDEKTDPNQSIMDLNIHQSIMETSTANMENDSLVLDDIRIMFNTSRCSDKNDDLVEGCAQSTPEPARDLAPVEQNIQSGSIAEQGIIETECLQPQCSSPCKDISGSNISCEINDSLVLNDIKIEFNPRDCLDESPYLKSLPSRSTGGSRKRIKDENDTPVKKEICSNLFAGQQKNLCSTPFNGSKKWRSASYNPGTSSPKSSTAHVQSPLMQIDANILNGMATVQPLGPPPVPGPLDNLFLSNLNVMNAVQKSDQCPNLIGDFSTTYALPLMSGRHKDLKTISPDALADLMRGNYKHIIDSFTIVDARYPYEYEGGHIDGSKNIYQKEGINSYFFGSHRPTANAADIASAKQKVLASSSNVSMVKCKRLRDLSVINESMEHEEGKTEPVEIKNTRHAIIFHCEFSSERGPTMYRHLRNKDRELNETSYPNLHYPELYLLHGGYKLFFEKFKDLCFPEMYLPMHSNDHKQDLKKFRTKSKSWHCERKWNTLFKENSFNS